MRSVVPPVRVVQFRSRWRGRPFRHERVQFVSQGYLFFHDSVELARQTVCFGIVSPKSRIVDRAYLVNHPTVMPGEFMFEFADTAFPLASALPTGTGRGSQPTGQADTVGTPLYFFGDLFQAFRVVWQTFFLSPAMDDVPTLLGEILIGHL